MATTTSQILKRHNLTGDDLEAYRTLETVNRLMIERGGRLVITIKHTSQSNLSFRFDVRLYYVALGGQVESLYLNWTYAQLNGNRLHKETREVKGNGIGIDRAFEVADNFARLFKFFDLPEIDLQNKFEGVY